ncbi:HlyD family type I secretion periplasmic adaptor subunit [Shimia sp. R10_1]|uniref:HlyD family type I secretion periplasmic adaptor subunit n=1 Tax=Shimia sp. R10_1 TaxID=2821095 RepID=UPI001ADC208E|nr:HlyD family type I secretion periplasmic adaptor subunit [Shimia sp. R10_1]MBO9471912.1 HlyD family type I secretion periplasmic adaptor subunit [Shimia sp. R10_1]
MNDKKALEPFRIDESPTAKWITRAAWATVVGLVAVVGWSVTAKVDEVAKAPGAVEPIAMVQRVESRHGGQVEEVLVRAGEMVAKGDVLVTMNRTEAQSALSATDARIAGLSLEVERLTSFVEKRAPDFSAYAKAYPALVAFETAAIQTQENFLSAERSVLEAQIKAKRAELDAIREQRPELERQISVAQEERTIEEDLVERGLSARARMVELIEREAQYRFDLSRLAGRETITEAAIVELQSSIERVDLDQSSTARNRIVDAVAERRALVAEAQALRARVEEAEVTAPLAGLVQTLPDESSGDVIEAGGMVAAIVPAEGGVRFSGRLSPRDVAFVNVGQEVRVKIESFDFSRYGSLAGVVEEVSPTTLFDDRGQAFYEVLVALPRDFFRAPEDQLSLLPGMTGEADIVTGSKTVFQYVWKPVFTNLDLALTER